MVGREVTTTVFSSAPRRPVTQRDTIIAQNPKLLGAGAPSTTGVCSTVLALSSCLGISARFASVEVDSRCRVAKLFVIPFSRFTEVVSGVDMAKGIVNAPVNNIEGY